MKKTEQLQRVVRAIRDTAAEGQRIYGYPLAKRAGVRSGTLYPILWRLEAQHCLTSHWEEKGESDPYPRRRYYQIAEGWDTNVLL